MPTEINQSGSSLQLTGLRDLNTALAALAKDINDEKAKRKILLKAGKPVVKAAKNIAPKRSRGGVNYRYNTPKLIGGVRAPNGKGVRVAEYLKGNLAGAIRVLGLRKSIRAIIGPRISKRGKGYGRFGPSTGKFDAYYAQMIFGSAKAFQRKVMISALTQKASEVRQVIANELSRDIKKSANKNGLNVS